MARPRAGDGAALLDDVEQTREQLHDRAREELGITGVAGPVPTLRSALRSANVGLYPLIALGALLVADGVHSYAFAVLAPEIARATGIGKGSVAGILAVKTLAIAVAPLAIAALVQRVPRRGLLSLVTAGVWSATSVFLGYVVTASGLAFGLALDGLSTGSVSTLHVPLLMDTYPPEIRVRILSYYRGLGEVATVGSPLLVALLVGPLGYTWRGVFVALGVLSAVATVVAVGLRDPGFGRFDTERIRGAVHDLHGDGAGAGDQLSEDDVALGFFEIVRRLLVIPSVRRLLAGATLLGVMTIPFQTFLFFYLQERWGLDPTGRGLFFAFSAALSIGALVAVGSRGEALFRRDPGLVLNICAAAIIAAVVLFALGAVAPAFPMVVALYAAGSCLVAVIAPLLNVSILSPIPARMRSHAAALVGIFSGGVGGIAGAVLLSGVDRRYGVVGSMVSLLVPGVLGGLVFASAKKLLLADTDRMIDEVLEAEEVRRLTSSGAHLPMLACRGVEFSYGQLQVLFDVDFTVDDGEMVALLGVNGAGKSTLLRVISGIGLPSRGSVRFRGGDITYLDAERRVRLGITQVPGGRAVFSPMSVADNLRTFGYTLGRDRRVIDPAIDRCFEMFPRLAERKNQAAATLSGGEQQMLGLSRALILQPRLLLIDELSLGLAPMIVSELLEMVRQINAGGTAVVLVEQSVNIALNLVDHAYFMEKGEIRFNGRSADLLGRDDLLRAVFLQGAAAAETTGKRR
ncbi:MAG: MFS transporter [Actinobacteria bacterium]|nr:MFS transporter [Actinomycetota bacterium]